ncbi:MAG: YkgJ family cysteine cluster protein [Desulfosarcinaceae bacterium]|nr:YkgJ family cysteine cluster protein [Desulfosarcinaceae bacterium]
MDFDFTPFFKRYEALAEQAEAAFDKIQKDHPECVKCAKECSDCCHALFDVTLIEALYINHKFNAEFEGASLQALLERANRSDRAVHRLKRDATKALQSGADEADILAKMAEYRVPCPLLNENKLCDLYDYRPITCRLYGVPTAIGGQGHTCGVSAFEPGKPYPTVNLDAIQDRLFALSRDLIVALGSRHVRMGDMVVPLSMALLTAYDDAYLGVSTEPDASEEGGAGEQK